MGTLGQYSVDQRLASMLPVLEALLRHDGDLGLRDADAVLLVVVSAATFDPHQARERVRRGLPGMLEHQARDASPESDSPPHQGRVDRELTELSRGRPGGPRRDNSSRNSGAP